MAGNEGSEGGRNETIKKKIWTSEFKSCFWVKSPLDSLLKTTDMSPEKTALMERFTYNIRSFIVPNSQVHIDHRLRTCGRCKDVLNST